MPSTASDCVWNLYCWGISTAEFSARHWNRSLSGRFLSKCHVGHGADNSLSCMHGTFLPGVCLRERAIKKKIASCFSMFYSTWSMYPEGVTYLFLYFLFVIFLHCVGKIYTFKGSWRQNASLFNLKELAFGNSFSSIPATKDFFFLIRKKNIEKLLNFTLHFVEWHYWIGRMVKAELPMS